MDCMGVGRCCGHHGYSCWVWWYYQSPQSLPTLGGWLSAVRGRTLMTPTLHTLSDAHGRTPFDAQQPTSVPGPPPLLVVLLGVVFLVLLRVVQKPFPAFIPVENHQRLETTPTLSHPRGPNPNFSNTQVPPQLTGSPWLLLHPRNYRSFC